MCRFTAIKDDFAISETDFPNSLDHLQDKVIIDIANPNAKQKLRLGLGGFILPTPGEAKAKAMPGRLYIHT